MTSTRGRLLRCCILLALGGALVGTTGSGPAQAHHSSGALVGGLLAGGVGGALLMNAFNQNKENDQVRRNEQPEVIYQAVPVAPTATVSERLSELKSLCDQGLVTPTECQARQAQILQGADL